MTTNEGGGSVDDRTFRREVSNVSVFQALLPYLGGIVGGGVLITFFAKTLHWPRPWERMVVSGPRGLTLDKDGNVREFTGFTPRLAGAYRTATVNIRDHMDNILLKVMRPASDDSHHPESPERHREKWDLAATIKWHVEPGEGRIYKACEWHITDLGEFVRGTVQDTILVHLEGLEVTMELNTATIFAECEPKARIKLLEHGVVWTALMVNDHTLADPEIQGKSIRRVAKAIENIIPFRSAA